MKATKGFTLVEIMIAVAIIAILSAIAIPAYNGYITTSRTRVACSNMDSIQTLMEDHNLDNNSYEVISGTSGQKLALLGWEADGMQRGDFDEYTYDLSSGTLSYTVTVVHIDSSTTVACSFPNKSCTPSCQ